MSRINRTPIQNGQAVTAADLNSRFTDFSQAGAINQFNSAEASIDLPQMQTGWQAQYLNEIVLGQSDLLMATPNSVLAATAVPAAGAIVEDYAGVDSVMNFGLSGKTVSNREVLRLYWQLTVNGHYDITSPPTSSEWRFEDEMATGFDIQTGQACYVMFPEWDITSSALANFVPVPGQSDFQDAIGLFEGAALEDCEATTVIPAGWVQYTIGALAGIPYTLLRRTNKQGWMGVSGAWHYSGEESGAVTVYGIRWRILGICHPYTVGNINYLRVEPAFGDPANYLEYTSGSASCIIHRTR